MQGVWDRRHTCSQECNRHQSGRGGQAAHRKVAAAQDVDEVRAAHERRQGGHAVGHDVTHRQVVGHARHPKQHQHTEHICFVTVVIGRVSPAKLQPLRQAFLKARCQAECDHQPLGNERRSLQLCKTWSSAHTDRWLSTPVPHIQISFLAPSQQNRLGSAPGGREGLGDYGHARLVQVRLEDARRQLVRDRLRAEHCAHKGGICC